MCEWIKSAKVGDKIVCIDANIVGGYPLKETRPVVGRVYTIREILLDYPCKHEEFGPFIRLSEINNRSLKYSEGDTEAAFSYRRFRPLQSRPTDISVFTKLLNTVPADEMEAV